MTVSSRADLGRLLEVAEAVAAFEDLSSLRSGILPQLHELIDCDSATYNEIDPSGAAAYWLTEPAEVGERADDEAFVTFLSQHPIAAFHATRGGGAVQFDDFLSRAELHRLELYQDFYRPLEVEHQIAISIAAPGPVLVPISVQRRRHRFSERDRELLDLLRPHLASAYRRLAELDAVRALLALALLERDPPEPLEPGRLHDAFGLTPREAEVLSLAAGGATNREIGTELYISPRTVQKHLASVYRKLGVHSRTAAVSRALEAVR